LLEEHFWMPIVRQPNVSQHPKLRIRCFFLRKELHNDSFPFILEYTQTGQTAARTSTRHRPNEMSVQEAYQILNIKDTDPIEKLHKV
jgi:hypothetical protein